jgi:PAS domain S-box-containing protein
MQTDARDSAVLDAILKAAVDAILVSDETGLILRANPAACHMFQYTPKDLLDQPVNMLMPNSVAHHHDGYMLHHIETGEKRIIGIGRDVEGLRKDGTVFPLHLSVGKTRIDDKTLFIGILHDRTRHQATQDALARSQRLDAIGQMTGGIAHDFNNLLTVIVGNLELLERRGANDRQVSLIRDALEAAELGADLTKRLLVFARKSNLKPIAANLQTLCKDTMAMLRRTLGSNYHIVTKYGPNLASVMIDPVQLQSALVNLVLNARDAMGDKGELMISVDNVSVDDTYVAQETDMKPGDYVRLSVNDNGTGMSVEAQKRAFEPFFTTKQNSGGSGLGLAMVYGFVRQSGGHITLYSEVGLGTSFGLYFPSLSEPYRTSASQPTDLYQRRTPRASGEVVLVVEDNPRVRRLSIERIRDLGFETKEAKSGDAAYAILKSGVHADIVFTDLVMPGTLNGYQLAVRIREEFPKIKVLLTSGYASDVVTATLAHEQSHDILHKPYSQSELARRLQSLLDGVNED